MKNFDFLNWIAGRLVDVYKESPNVDFVHRLRKVAKEILRLESDVVIWKFRAVAQARWRIRLAKEKNRLKILNQSLLNKVYSWQVDDEGIRISYGALYADENMIRMELERENEELKRDMEQNLRAAQHAEATLAAIRERAERIQEGEIWNLVSFVLKKIPVKHAPECWKNQVYLNFGVRGYLASCTCGAEKN